MASIDTTKPTDYQNSAWPSQSAPNTVAPIDSASLFTSCPDDTGHTLVENSDAKEKARKKVSQAIELIKKYAPEYHQKGFGPDFSKELEALGEQNIEVTPTKKTRSMADNIYRENSEVQKRPSTKNNGDLFSSSKIFVHYNNDDVYNAAPEEIAATIVHELGHLEDKDDITSKKEEEDVEIQARNFETFIQKPDGFKFNPKPKGLDCFTKLYNEKKNFGDFSPHHGM